MSVASDDHLIATAHNAFGGHISKGLLKRARAAVNRRCKRAEKQLRLAIFGRISNLPSLWRCKPADWEEVSDIVYRCIIAADLGDHYDYHAAGWSESGHDRIEALRHFVTRYAGSRRQKSLLSRLDTAYRPIEAN